MPEMTLAERIAKIRKDAEDSPAKAAEWAGVSRQAYMKWEQGNTENMKLGNLLKFCDHYHVNIEALIRGSDHLHYSLPTDAPQVVLVAREGKPMTDERQLLDADQQRLIAGYNVASEETRQTMLAIADVALQRFSGRSGIN
jgi:DNA-binding XRE family transcriptional regulator